LFNSVQIEISEVSPEGIRVTMEDEAICAGWGEPGGQ